MGGGREVSRWTEGVLRRKSGDKGGWLGTEEGGDGRGTVVGWGRLEGLPREGRFDRFGRWESIHGTVRKF